MCYSDARPWQYVAAPAKLSVASGEEIVAMLASGGAVLSTGLLVLLAMWAFCLSGPKEKDAGVADAVALVVVVDGEKEGAL